MSDSSPLRSITVMREPKSAKLIAPRMLAGARVGGARPFLASHLAVPTMLRDVLLRTAEFGARFEHYGERGFADPGSQSFALRRLRRRQVPEQVSTHRFHWPVSAKIPSSRMAARSTSDIFDAADSFDANDTPGYFESPNSPDSLDFLTGHSQEEIRISSAEAELPGPNSGMSAGQMANQGFRQQRTGDRNTAAGMSAGQMANHGVRQLRTFERISPVSMPFQRSHVVSQNSAPGSAVWSTGPVVGVHGRDFWEFPEAELPPRPSPFTAALQRSGEASNRPGSSPPASLVPILTSGRFGTVQLPLYMAPAPGAREGARSTLEHVLQRTSWQPFVSSGAPRSGAGSEGSSFAQAVTRWNESPSSTLPFADGAINRHSAGSGFLPPPHSPPADSVRSRLAQAQSSVEPPMPLNAGFGSQQGISSTPRDQRIPTIGRIQLPAEEVGIAAHPAEMPEGAMAGDDFPTVLRRALAGPGSRGWSETGPVSPIWGELGQLVKPQTVPASSRSVAPTSMQLRRTVRDRQMPGGSAGALTTTTSPSSRWSVGSTWTPPTSVEQSFPPVFRSAIVDRAEPDAERQSAAHEIMTASIGAPLPPLIRRSMEARLGSDLGSVRVHSGPAIGRATDMLAARAMTRGSDVFMPSGVSDHHGTESMPLLAHELTHAATHLGHAEPAPVQRSPLVLAQRASNEESQAEQVERAVSSEIQSRFPGVQPGTATGMTLARQVANTTSPSMPLNVARSESAAPIQRDETSGTAVASTPQVVPEATPATPATDAGVIAEKVYALLERRLVVERERGGYRRP